jgi:hypothetical protein
MPRKHGEVCRDVTLTQGDAFDWQNHGETACHIHVDPSHSPLVVNDYDVPAGGSVPAAVKPNAPTGDYPYSCSCTRSQLHTNPKIIIS